MERAIDFLKSVFPKHPANLKELARFEGRTYRNSPLTIVRYENASHGPYSEYFVALKDAKIVGCVGISPEGKNYFLRMIKPKTWKTHLAPGVAGKGIMPALHAHALESLLERKGVKIVSAEGNIVSRGWEDKLEKLHGLIDFESTTWDLNELRKKQDWKVFLLREEK